MSRISKYIRQVNRKMRRRTKYIYLAILAGMIIIISRLLFVYFVDGDRYSKAALETKQLIDQTIQYRRGDILDRNGVVLAKSDVAFNVIFDPAELTSEFEREKKLFGKKFNENDNILTRSLDIISGELGISRGEIKKIYELNKDKRYYILKKNLHNKDIEKLRDKVNNDSKITKFGIWFENKYKRVYPFNELGGNLIGFVNDMGNPICGIESQYDEELRGTNGRDYQYFDQSRGLIRNTIPPVDGNNVVLTIDVGVQKIITDKIKTYYEKNTPKNMAILVMNPSNGEVLGMASTPLFNLNKPNDHSEIKIPDGEKVDSKGNKSKIKREWKDLEEKEKIDLLTKRWQNYVVSHAFEPGSTFKPITLAAGLELKKFNIDTTFVCDGGEKVYDYYIACVNRKGHGTLTAAQALQHSCNDSMMQMVKKIGASNFIHYQRLFNFGAKTNIDLPDEIGHLQMIKSIKNIGPVDLATNSFGQNFDVNMMQIACADGAIGNNGKYYRPHVGLEIRDSKNVTIKKFSPELVKQVISRSIAGQIKLAMRMVIEDTHIKGWSKIEGYENQLFGKSGTAEKLPRKEDKYISTFLEMAPFDDPKVLVYVLIDEGDHNVATDHASQISTEILKELLPMLNIPKNK